MTGGTCAELEPGERCFSASLECDEGDHMLGEFLRVSLDECEESAIVDARR